MFVDGMALEMACLLLRKEYSALTMVHRETCFFSTDGSS